jgi:hypothetical protein
MSHSFGLCSASDAADAVSPSCDARTSTSRAKLADEEPRVRQLRSHFIPQLTSRFLQGLLRILYLDS